MNRSIKVAQNVIAFVIAGSFLTSCGGSQTTLESNVASGTTTGGNTGQSSGTQTVADEEANATIPTGYSASELFVTVPDTLDYTQFTSISSSHSERCAFTSSSLVNDLTCVVNAGELSLFYGGIKLQYNVPANQCSHIGTLPYYFYNSEVGYGPTAISATITVSGTVQSQLCQVNGGPVLSCDTTSPPTSWNDIRWAISETGANAECVYDTSKEDNGTNCCLGKYRKTIKFITPDGVTVTDELGQSWGGSVGSCIAGPGKTDWENKSAEGLPIYLIEKMKTGVKRTKIITGKGGIETSLGTNNISIANYFTQGLHTHTGFGTASGTRISEYPYYVDPVSDRSGTLIPAANPDYIFDCLNEAFEVTQRIRVRVQEWDTVAALSSYITTGVSGTPVFGADNGTADETGTAPTACPGLSGEPCNQALDSDNFVQQTPFGFYSNGSPSYRKNYFPNIPSL